MSLAVAMYIGDSEFKGQAPGPFVGLDLTEDLYVGAVPDFGRIARAAGFGNGFTGQSITASVVRLFPPPALGAIRLSVPWRSCLCYRQAGCLQLSHRRPPEMCGLLTRPRTDVDPPRFLDRTAIGGGAYRLAASGAIPCFFSKSILEILLLISLGTGK